MVCFPNKLASCLKRYRLTGQQVLNLKSLLDDGTNILAFGQRAEKVNKAEQLPIRQPTHSYLLVVLLSLPRADGHSIVHGVAEYVRPIINDKGGLLCITAKGRRNHIPVQPLKILEMEAIAQIRGLFSRQQMSTLHSNSPMGTESQFHPC